jgi:putative ABC transport system ATP-binding protein
MIDERPVLARCQGLTVVFRHGGATVTALSGVDLAVGAGEAVALWGRSGSGKTTLLHALGGLVAPDDGTVEWLGESLATLDTAARARVRAGGIAYVFQGANLLPNLTAFENLAFAARASTAERSDLTPLQLLELVGLAAKADHLPAELSGGEAQRVAIARALAQRPHMLLCDEPTGHLDSDTGDRVLDLIDALHSELGFALVVATHDADVVARYEHAVELADGRVVHDEVHA